MSPTASRRQGGLYLVVFHLFQDTRLTVGALGEAQLGNGYYAYTGSARVGLRARVERHFRRDKPRRWHIDHLSSSPLVRPSWSLLLPDAPIDECTFNQTVGRLIQGQVPIPRFGASDCARGCPAHLWYTRDPVWFMLLDALVPASSLPRGPDRP